MPAGEYNFEIEQGAKFVRTIDVDEDGSDKDLTGYTAALEIRSGPGGSLVRRLATSTGEIEITAGIGRLVLTLTAAETAALDFSSAVYDLFLTPATGADDRERLLQGRVRLSRKVTS